MFADCEELKRAVDARDEFLSIASHELKTPLTTLRLLIQAFQRRLSRPAAAIATLANVPPDFRTMDRQVDRLEKLINDLLDVSRITAGRLDLELEEMDLSELAHEVMERFGGDLDRVGAKLVRSGDAPVGRWDRTRIDQVLTNLISNALKYGAAKPIEIGVAVADGRARFWVRDQGIGIAQDDQARIFERFERLLSVRHYGGFGLGLWIVRKIVEAHRGTIQVTSRPGEGSLFTVELPCQPSGARATRVPSRRARVQPRTGGEA
jgi:signal transduction histidine kinase